MAKSKSPPKPKLTLAEMQEQIRIMTLKFNADCVAKKEAERVRNNQLHAEARLRLKAGHIAVTEIEKFEEQKHKNISESTKRSSHNRTPEQKENLARIVSEKTKSRWDAMDPLTKDRWIRRLHAGRDKHWQEMPENVRERVIHQRLEASYVAQKALWDLLSDSEKTERMAKVNAASQEQWRGLTEAEKKERLALLHEGNKRWWDSLPPEEQKQRMDSIRQKSKQHWNSLSQEEKDRRITVANKASQKEWKSLEKEEKASRIAALKNNAENWWASLSPEERKKRSQHSTEVFQKFWKDVSGKEYVEIFSRRNKKIPNKPEAKLLALMPPCCEYTGNWTFWIHLSTGRKNPDFVVRPYHKFKAVIEFHGDYWHRGEDVNVLINAYADKGVKCLVVWEHELKDLVAVKRRIDEFLTEVGIHVGNS